MRVIGESKINVWKTKTKATAGGYILVGGGMKKKAGGI